MARRLTIYLRRGLFGVGVGVLLTLPLFYLFLGWISVPWPVAGVVLAGQGNLVFVVEHAPTVQVVDAGFYRDHRDLGLPTSLHPTWFRYTGTVIDETWVTFPLWLLAAVCLAWPTTSFLLARRRQGRGFEVAVEGKRTRVRDE